MEWWNDSKDKGKREREKREWEKSKTRTGVAFCCCCFFLHEMLRGEDWLGTRLTSCVHSVCCVVCLLSWTNSSHIWSLSLFSLLSLYSSCSSLLISQYTVWSRRRRGEDISLSHINLWLTSPALKFSLHVMFHDLQEIKKERHAVRQTACRIRGKKERKKDCTQVHDSHVIFG